MIKVAINGFGRIGRPSFKIIFEREDMEVVAINDLADAENLAYLLKYDSAYGVYGREVKSAEGKIIVDGKEIPVFAEKDPNNLPWKELEVDVVLECTGIFITREGATGHISAGAKKVVISAPAKDESIKTFVMGVNEKEITNEDDIISNASCTTNCLAPVMKVLNDEFGVEKAMMTTVHSYTSTQTIIDVATGKDKRRGRASGQSVIPTTTGAAIATTLVIPSLKDNFDGMAFRIPTIVGSACDLTAILKKDVTENDINDALARAEQNYLKGILQVTDEALVSHDIVGNYHSAIVQKELTKVVGGNFVKVIAWYDNEWGYSCRLVDMANCVGKIK
ncbi:MAG: Glyceraldehyde-3-phosphate dehydrogenase, type I [Candidatus Moranbacteria bacterium GW2011_GWE1_35_17]|nr:MAG: Glyceraldehyde-3-phosphate dehydrogenase, type I [Candidatus Moranbacteria bacterium GW2011_GWE1_35_17]KKP81064.1 MAG: Glyceraldehyde-3-phosphate dehydrogenase, type I [Candidatus Moranbacteria bacterium GW2011_GWF1_35_5]